MSTEENKIKIPRTEFVNYKPISGESYLGIVTIKRHGQDFVRFKWVPRKDGKGHFHSSPGIKDKTEDGEKYLPSFMVDSISDKEEMEEIIHNGVKKTLQLKGIRPVQMEMSALQPQPTYQPKSSNEQESYDDIPF